MNLVPGVKAISTTDSAVGVSGMPVRVFSVSMISDGTAGTLKLRNGTAATDTIYLQIDGTASKCATFDSAAGVLFPSGCFMDADTHTVSGLIAFTMEH